MRSKLIPEQRRQRRAERQRRWHDAHRDHVRAYQRARYRRRRVQALAAALAAAEAARDKAISEAARDKAISEAVAHDLIAARASRPTRKAASTRCEAVAHDLIAARAAAISSGKSPWDGYVPAKPGQATQTPAGTHARVAVYAARFAAGEPLFLPGDFSGDGE